MWRTLSTVNAQNHYIKKASEKRKEFRDHPHSRLRSHGIDPARPGLSVRSLLTPIGHLPSLVYMTSPQILSTGSSEQLAVRCDRCGATQVVAGTQHGGNCITLFNLRTSCLQSLHDAAGLRGGMMPRPQAPLRPNSELRQPGPHPFSAGPFQPSNTNQPQAHPPVPTAAHGAQNIAPAARLATGGHAGSGSLPVRAGSGALPAQAGPLRG